MFPAFCCKRDSKEKKAWKKNEKNDENRYVEKW